VFPDIQAELSTVNDTEMGLRLTCPSCGQRRFFSNGQAVLHSADQKLKT